MLRFFITLLFSSVLAIEVRNGVYEGRRIPAWMRMKLENGQMNLRITIAMMPVINFENLPFATSLINEEFDNDLNLHLDALQLTEALIYTNRAVSSIASTIEAPGVSAIYYEHGPDGASEHPAVVVTVRDITNRRILNIIADLVIP